MKRISWLIWSLVCLALGSFYEFVPRASIKALWPALLFDISIGSMRIRQNDLILVATILLTVGIVFLYKWLKMGKN